MIIPRLTFLVYFVFLFLQVGQAQAFVDKSQESGINSVGLNHGIAVGDMNNDGFEDFYVSRVGSSNLLFVNRGNFVFEESAAIFGLDYSGDTNMSLWLDYDNDGDLDILLGNKFASVVLYRNDGSTFTNVTNLLDYPASGNLRSLNAVDYDNDGDLDIYVALLGAQNVLYQNQGGSGFKDVTLEAGIYDAGSSMAAIFFDYDNDGDQDLYQSHDGNQPNLLYNNQGDGTFANASSYSHTDYAGFGMGTDVADFNHDGYLDLYLTNLYENVLFVNNQDGTFSQIAANTPINDIGMSWGTFAFDCDNDGNPDIYVANESDFNVSGKVDIPNKLFRNLGNLNFEELVQPDPIRSLSSSYGTTYADFDSDGRLDVVIANYGDNGNQLLRNQSPSQNYLAVKLHGIESNIQGIGSVVELYSGEYYHKTQLVAGAGYASQNTSKLHFGLGQMSSVDSLLIHWPTGKSQKIEHPNINTTLTIEETAAYGGLGGAVVWTDPAFPTQLDDVTVFFDSNRGNGALANFTGTVYAHAGLITNNSNSPSDWKYVQGTWGTADAKTAMTAEGDGIHSLSYNIADFYGIPNGEEVKQLAFVFRNADGSIVGRDTDGSDIFLNVYASNDGLLATLYAPSSNGTIIYLGDSIEVSLQVNKVANITVTDNGQLVYQDTAELADFYITPTELGPHAIEILVTDDDGGEQLLQANYFVLETDQPTENPPSGTKNGINYPSDQSYIFQLSAPAKQHVFLLCPANNFEVDFSYQLNKADDNATFWIELPKSLFLGGNNTYQYLVDGSITVADPYSTVVLDPWNDGGVPQDVLAELPEYPSNASGIVTAFDLQPSTYPWQVNDFQAPDKTKLIIYELLMRDFLSDHNYKSLLDTLDYLTRLGVNAIELMPINEFEGNQSWGYNPSYHMAIDKYYGSRDQLRAVIDACHSRGIAVLLDVVFNHVFSQSPLAQMYWDAANFRPSADNPWLNVVPRHPFNVGYDVNHESQASRDWVKQVLSTMMQEYRFDGFRFDLSKGFTQTNSGDNADQMSQYDQGRINTLKYYADHIWSINPKAFVILEHFAYNEEEIALANYGMMLWGNMTYAFAQAAKGKTSSVKWLDYKERGWNNPNIIGYMESHDEERLLYDVLESGASEGDYDTRELEIALRRVEAASVLFTTLPGPRMLWQFGELGYDYSINRCTNGSISPNCRLDPKPIRWDYQMEEGRARLYDRVSAINHLKTTYPTFSTTNYTLNDANFYVKTLHLYHTEMDAVVLTNFRVESTEFNPKFPYTGTWYEYFTGIELEVVDVNAKLPLLPGDYRVYTSKKVTPPNGYFTTNTRETQPFAGKLYPNPVGEGELLYLEMAGAEGLDWLTIVDTQGQQVANSYVIKGQQVGIDVSTVKAGIYFIQLSIGGESQYGRFVKM